MKGCSCLNYNKILRLLISLGIRKLDAEIYLFLVNEGPNKARLMSNELKINKQQLYRSLKRLQKKGLVKASNGHPSNYAATTVEDSLNSFRKTKLGEAQFIKEKKDELLSR